MKMRMVKMALLLAGVLALNGGSSFAQESFETTTLPNSNGYTLIPGQEVSFEIPGGWRYVKELHVSVSSDYGSQVQVWTNGGLKKEFRVPCEDPYYVVQIRETARTVEFRNYGNHSVYVNYVAAVLSLEIPNANPSADYPSYYPPALVPSTFYPPGYLPGLPATNVATWLSKRAITLVDDLRDSVDPETEYVTYLLPIKTVAGTSYAVASANGDLSDRTKQAMEALSQQILFADPVLSRLLKRQDTFERAVQLTSIKYQIDNRLQ